MDVVGKLVARVLQERLQKVAEQELLESQCGFRKGAQLLGHDIHSPSASGETIEHGAKLFLIFVDLGRPTILCHGLHSGMHYTSWAYQPWSSTSSVPFMKSLCRRRCCMGSHFGR